MSYLSFGSHVDNVAQFMMLGDQPPQPSPAAPEHDTILLRARLILEEALETINAMGVAVIIDGATAGMANAEFELDPDAVDLVALADGVADLTVVATGTALAFGIDPLPVQQIVDQSNLAKVINGVTRDSNGKIVKPTGWQPPNVAAEIARQTSDDSFGKYLNSLAIFDDARSSTGGCCGGKCHG